MKKWILLLAGILILTVAGCKDDEDAPELKATFSMKTWDNVNGAIELGEVKNTFIEKENIAFDMVLKNQGTTTAHIEYASCGFDIVEIYNDDDELVYHSEVTTTGCSGQWNIKIVYSGESIGTPTLWDQEMYYQDPDTGDITGTGEYLPAGKYTVRAVARYKLNSSDADWSRIIFTDQSLTIESAQ